ncbi:MAG: biosynthetic arginine decarboxylase [Pirellulaceae bacterium]|nr:biosynthetic arginine decarboxylase [Pirellulaceae bacterium]
MLPDATDGWTVADAADYYQIERWGNGYFSVDPNGHLRIHPDAQKSESIDLPELVHHLDQNGTSLPVLMRFDGILKHRFTEIEKAFRTTISDYGYDGQYTCVYPIKVNQQRHVVDGIIRGAQAGGFGLEAGSKPELLAVIASAHEDMPIICNGFKDAEFVEMALLAQQLGRRVILVVERLVELNLITKTALRIGVSPEIGMRIKLAARGSGRWQASGGHRSKFGLTVSELLSAVETLRQDGNLEWFKLLHFHLGSQITNIRQVKRALTEAARVYVDLVARGASLKYLDVGGGLGVDYDGSQTTFDSSMNYTLQEYANDVVFHVQSICDEVGIPHPHLISESGRALVAFHSLLVFPVLGVNSLEKEETMMHAGQEDPRPLRDLVDTLDEVTTRNLLESFHDAQLAIETAMNLFSTGHLSLTERGRAEKLFWVICERIRQLAKTLEFIPEELEPLGRLLADTYFCNFSLFQSLPDSWALNQIFPVMPIQRLHERPTRKAVIGDITCDSDGKIDRFLNNQSELSRTLDLHEVGEEPYYLATFLVGAYQEILGDLHNLFGDTNAVHVSLSDTGEVVIESTIRGDSVKDVLGYVAYDTHDITAEITRLAQAAVQQKRISEKESARIVSFYEERLDSYTYLETPGMPRGVTHRSSE